jgi:hypothetical protein
MVAFMLLVIFCVSIAGMRQGEWLGFLGFGVILLLLIFPRLKPLVFFRRRFAWRDRVFDVLVLIGILSVAFAVLRYVTESAFHDRLNSYVATNDLTSLVREATHASWRGEREEAADALDKAIIRKAQSQTMECAQIGDKPFKRSAQALVWDNEKNSPHAAQALLHESRVYQHGEVPLTVFFVSGKQSRKVGTYSISLQPAFLEWVNVCAVRFDAPRGPGQVVNSHEVVSLDPAKMREVKNVPEYGDPAPPVAEWVSGGIHYASGAGAVGTVEAVLKDNPDLVSSKDRDGQTPLHLAAEKDRKEVAQFLLAHGADVNAKDNNGNSPLHVAAERGSKVVAELLLAGKADVNIKNNNGATPLDLAVRADRTDVAELLRQHGGQE